VEFQFAYGEGSYERHIAEARRHQLEVRVLRIAELAFDVDVAADLDILANGAEHVQ
jgi:2-phospho-L-lactate guanylyltransferase (CobY/MobA/RfbA family)